MSLMVSGPEAVVVVPSPKVITMDDEGTASPWSCYPALGQEVELAATVI